MAKTTIIQISDDLDGSTPAESVRFALQGVEYEVDLSSANAAELEAALAPYTEAGTRVGGRRKSAGASKTRSDLPDIRAWAKKNKHEVSDRGRIPAAVIEAYDAAR